MSLRPLHIRYAGTERRSYYPRLGQRGFSYVTVERDTEGENQLFPWVWRKVFEFDMPGEYTLVAEPPSLMLYEPIVKLDIGRHLVDKELDIVFPEKDEEDEEMPVLEKEIELRAEEEEEEEEENPEEQGEEEEEKPETLAYKSVRIRLSYNEEDFPVQWKMKKTGIIEEVADENGFLLDETWKNENERLEYYCGIGMTIRMRIRITAINGEPLERFNFSALGRIRLSPGETGVIVKRRAELDTSLVEYIVEAVHNNTIEVRETILGPGQTFTGILDFTLGFKLRFRSGLDTDILEFDGDLGRLDGELGLPKISCKLSGGMFDMNFTHWE